MSNQIGLLIMTHGDFGKAAVASTELVIGKQNNYQTMDIFVIDEIDNLKNEMLAKVDLLNTHAGLVVMTDIVGGTPINLASQLLNRDNVIVLSGINLPMLITFFMERTSGFQALREILKEAYNEGFVIRTLDDLKETGESDEYSL